MFECAQKLPWKALYASSDVPTWKTSPLLSATGKLVDKFRACECPGLPAVYWLDNPGAFPGLVPLARSFIGRSYRLGCFPGTGGAQEGYRKSETYRLSGSYIR